MGEDRKPPAEGQNDAFDPEPTCGLAGWLLCDGARDPSEILEAPRSFLPELPAAPNDLCQAE
jgi:hypothetical protein